MIETLSVKLSRLEALIDALSAAADGGATMPVMSAALAAVSDYVDYVRADAEIAEDEQIKREAMSA